MSFCSPYFSSMGDPFSPYLFLLCAEAFSGLMKKAANEGLTHGARNALWLLIFSVRTKEHLDRKLISINLKCLLVKTLVLEESKQLEIFLWFVKW